MQPIKLTLRGKFWDSQIYSGKLYLFNINGEVQTIKWDKLIDEFNTDQKLSLAMKCAFTQSSLLYGYESLPFIDDVEIKEVIKNKFEILSELDMDIDQKFKSFETIYKTKQESPFPFPHTDICIYGNRMFASSMEGLFQASCNGKTTYPISTKVSKGWDAPISSISASYGSIAIAAGSEGLFEKKLDNWNLSFKSEESSFLAKGNFSSCNWLYYSIFGSSSIGDSVLADFNQVEDKVVDEDFVYRRFRSNRSEIRKRQLNEIFSNQELFPDSYGYSWGNQDKIYIANDSEISILKYKPWDEDQRFIPLEKVKLYAWKGKVVSASTALFGTVVECENALVILPTEGDPITIPGEPTNWRVFTRSKNYENQLHVIYNDRLEIYSFNHDYFVDQDSKKLGIKRPYVSKR